VTLPFAPPDLARRAGGGRSAVVPSPEKVSVLRRQRGAVVSRLLVDRVLRRGRWAIHRHVHLVAAYEQAAARAPIETLLSVGAGAALSELYLAALHPQLAVTISDFDDGHLERARARARRLGLANVEVCRLDLLAEPPAPRHDLTVGIEVLEHIDDDGRAVAHLLAMTRTFLYQLVPFCTEAQRADPARRRRAWEHNEHYRPGYTHATLAELFADSRPEWVRNCYFQPEASALRAQIESLDQWGRLRRRNELVLAACADVRDEQVSEGADGIEILTRPAG
jgi:hypothetical protein